MSIKKKVYLDSTIFSYYCDNRKEINYHIQITKKWWKEERKNYNLFISEEVIFELNNGNSPRKAEALKLLNGLSTLDYNDDILNIAKIYLQNFLVPQALKGDALHLACSSYYGIDFF